MDKKTKLRLLLLDLKDLRIRTEGVEKKLDLLINPVPEEMVYDKENINTIESELKRVHIYNEIKGNKLVINKVTEIYTYELAYGDIITYDELSEDIQVKGKTPQKIEEVEFPF